MKLSLPLPLLPLPLLPPRRKRRRLRRRRAYPLLYLVSYLADLCYLFEKLGFQAPAAAGPKVQTLAGGLEITDAKVGTGAAAKAGSKVGMRYIGKLENGKVFDSNTKGSPLSFTLGRGQVITGWDKGIVGMQVGGERKLRIRKFSFSLSFFAKTGILTLLLLCDYLLPSLHNLPAFYTPPFLPASSFLLPRSSFFLRSTFFLLLPTAAAMAYGKKGTQGIPGNSVLLFDCKLVSLSVLSLSASSREEKH